MTSLGSVQRLHTRLRAIDDDTLVLADGRPRAIFEVFPPDMSLADDEALEAHTARLAAFLHGLTFPIQILLRLVPADLEAHACEVEAASAGRGLRIAAAGRDYAGLARHLGRTTSLLEPHLWRNGLPGQRRRAEGRLRPVGARPRPMSTTARE